MPSSQGERVLPSAGRISATTVVPERGLARVGRIGEGVALVEAPTRVDAHPLRPARRGDLQLDLESDLEAGVEHGGVRIRVEQERPVAHSREENGAASAVRLEVGGQRDT